MALCSVLHVSSIADIHWGHAVNSLSRLHTCLTRGDHFLEIDIRMGYEDDKQETATSAIATSSETSSSSSSSSTPIPILAHDPNTHGPSITEWLTTLSHTQHLVGVKFDFKSLEAVKDVIREIEKMTRWTEEQHTTTTTTTPTTITTTTAKAEAAAPTTSATSTCTSTSTSTSSWLSRIGSTIWLNADILSGPAGPLTTVIDAHTFITTCQSHEYTRHCWLSLGWTTGTDESTLETTSHNDTETDPVTSAAADTDTSTRNITPGYTASHIDAMLSLCTQYSLSHVTFPIRALYIRRSWTQLSRLLSHDERYTLTVWTAAGDEGRYDRQWIIQHVPQERVFLDWDVA